MFGDFPENVDRHTSNIFKIFVHFWNFWGFDFSTFKRFKICLLDAFQNRFRVFDYKEKAFKKFVKKLQRARYIHGYSSMIYQSAKLINDQNLPKP